MGSLAQREDLQDDEDKNSAFTWEVQANNRAYNAQFKEKVFLCWQKKKYKTNVIRTAKYNFFSFLPLNLYEQLHRVSNLYFLLIIILQSIPDISTLPWFSLGAPMVCLLFIRATRDLVDDIGRHKSDRTINNRPCQILMGKSFKRKKWQNLCVGDVVCLHKDNIVPADMLLLASTEPSSLCYVETVDIDGETNLKFRQALMVTHKELTSVKKMASFQGTVTCEAPNSRLHHFVGCLEWNDKKYSLDIGNLLLRGCRIRNTDTCYGMVIYAGFDTKIMKNCGKIHLKRTKLDLLMNKLVVVKVEEGPSEEIFAVEPLPHLYRESRARRSSYAFSHREGYADLITQGTILRRGPGVSSDIASESIDPSDEEAFSSPKESHWHLRKMSFLGKKKRQSQGQMSFLEAQHFPTSSSSFSMDRQSALYSENQLALPRYVLTGTHRLSGSFQEQLPRVQERPLSPKQRPSSPEKLPLTKERSYSHQEKPPLHRESQLSSSESQPQPPGSQSLLSGQLTLESQPDSSEEKSAFSKPSAPLWKSWQKEPLTPKEGMVPLPDKTHESQVETLPPSLAESSTSTSEQPMEVEPWPVEKQSSSSMEWLLVPGEEQPSLPPEEQSLPSAEGTRGQQ
uniref:ATPase phospholipid transporting 8B3 n=1 Tax=Macaca nemestrina TaxID=9545 RepID=A0A2K6C5Q9_MACNE